MTGDPSIGTVMWRKDGGDEIGSQQGLLQYTFSNPIQASDEGIYEIYYDNERSTGRGGLFRLIVRGRTIQSNAMHEKPRSIPFRENRLSARHNTLTC